MAYCMAILLMYLKVFLMVGIGILNLSSSAFMDGICVVALAPYFLHNILVSSNITYCRSITMFSGTDRII